MFYFHMALEYALNKIPNTQKIIIVRDPRNGREAEMDSRTIKKLMTIGPLTLDLLCTLTTPGIMSEVLQAKRFQNGCEWRSPEKFN